MTDRHPGADVLCRIVNGQDPDFMASPEGRRKFGPVYDHHRERCLEAEKAHGSIDWTAAEIVAGKISVPIKL